MSTDYNVKHFGAAGDGIAKDTAAIQAAIDQCSQRGGGRVILSEGCFLTGTLYWKSNVELYIDVTARIIASRDAIDYPADTYRQLYRNESHMDRCLIYAHQATNIALSGRGSIDGQGEAFHSFRPMLLRFHRCSGIRMDDVTLLNPASWTNAFIECEDIRVHNLTIHNRANWNGDGLDFNSCRKVFVSDCTFDCSDDCICIQNSEEGTLCGDIHISRCSFCSRWAGIRIGLLSCGDISDVIIDNCTFYHIDCSGLKIQSAEGARVRNILCSNLIMRDVRRPLFLTSNRFRERIERDCVIPTRSLLENIGIHHVYAESKPHADGQNACMILDSVDPGDIRNICLSDIHYTVEGGLNPYEAPSEIPTHSGRRAEELNYGINLPAFGLYARNISGLKLHDVVIDCLKPDARSMIALENCGEKPKE